MAEETKQKSLIGGLILLARKGLFHFAVQFAGGALLMSLYAVVVIIFRYAFHVELWSWF
jgi:hypothetical protein